MKTREDLTQRYRYVIEKVGEIKSVERECSRTVELFFSFDIVNSSLYKDENYFGWQMVLPSLLLDIQKEVTKQIPGSQLWRVLGDELVFFTTVKDKEEIYTSISAIYDVLVKENRQVASGFFEQPKSENQTNADIEAEPYAANNTILAVQSAAWLAIVLNGDRATFSAYDNFLPNIILVKANKSMNFWDKI